MNLIDISNLTKDYGNHKGIFNVSFSIKKGEVVGFIGSNGAGKTTTIRHLMGFIRPQHGFVRIMDMDCFHQADIIQNNIGYLPGEIAFMDQMSGYEFITFMAKMKNIKDLSHAKELISYLELDPSVKIKKMSKGMKQKIGLIIAFMQDAPILILDEPTSGLDPLMQNKFVELIKKEKEAGKTILMSSHIFEEIEHTCDRVIVIKEGSIIVDEYMNKIKTERNKHYEITFRNPKDAILFQSKFLDSIRNENTIQYVRKGDVNGLIQELSHYDVVDINARFQTLEEVFMRYYGGEGE